MKRTFYVTETFHYKVELEDDQDFVTVQDLVEDAKDSDLPFVFDYEDYLPKHGDSSLVIEEM